MKQFNAVWLPIVGVIFMMWWLFKGKLIPLYIEEFLIWVIYQAFLYSILFEIVFNLINNT